MPSDYHRDAGLSPRYREVRRHFRETSMGKFDGMDPKLVRDLLSEVNQASKQMRAVEGQVTRLMSGAGLSSQSTHRPSQIADACEVMVRDVSARVALLEKKIKQGSAPPAEPRAGEPKTADSGQDARTDGKSRLPRHGTSPRTAGPRTTRSPTPSTTPIPAPKATRLPRHGTSPRTAGPRTTRSPTPSTTPIPVPRERRVPRGTRRLPARGVPPPRRPGTTPIPTTRRLRVMGVPSPRRLGMILIPGW